MLGMVFLALSAGLIAAQDEKNPEMKKDKGEAKAKPPEVKAGDWSKFAKGPEAGGEVIKVSDTTLTLRNETRQGRTKKNIDTEYTWNEQGLARREKAPVFFNDKGLPRPGTSNELAALKKPEGVKGYAIERTELKNGDIVKLELVRPITVPATKAKPDDYTIKYAFMTGEKANPSAPPKK